MSESHNLNHPYAVVAGQPISLFAGILIRMRKDDLDEPHFYAEFDDKEAIISILEAKVISGTVPHKKKLLLEAWLSLHEDEMLANWTLLRRDEQLYPVNPLR